MLYSEADHRAFRALYLPESRGTSCCRSSHGQKGARWMCEQRYRIRHTLGHTPSLTSRHEPTEHHHTNRHPEEHISLTQLRHKLQRLVCSHFCLQGQPELSKRRKADVWQGPGNRMQNLWLPWTLSPRPFWHDWKFITKAGVFTGWTWLQIPYKTEEGTENFFS